MSGAGLKTIARWWVIRTTRPDQSLGGGILRGERRWRSRTAGDWGTEQAILFGAINYYKYISCFFLEFEVVHFWEVGRINQ